MLKHLSFFVTILLAGTIINFKNALYGSTLSYVNIIVTVIYILGICLYSFYSGITKDRSYIRFGVSYWSVIIILALLAQVNNISILNFLTIANIIPMYAISYLFSTTSASFLVGSLLGIEFLAMWLSFIIGNYTCKSNRSEEEYTA